MEVCVFVGGVNNTNKSCLEYSLQSMLISQSGSRKDVDIVPVCEKVKLLFSGLVHCVLIVVLLNLFIYFFTQRNFLNWNIIYRVIRKILQKSLCFN